MIKRLNYLPSFFAVRWDLGACSNPCWLCIILIILIILIVLIILIILILSHTRLPLSHAPASLTRACLSHLEAEVEVAREARAERAALNVSRLLRADGQEFAADAGPNVV